MMRGLETHSRCGYRLAVQSVKQRDFLARNRRLRTARRRRIILDAVCPPAQVLVQLANLFLAFKAFAAGFTIKIYLSCMVGIQSGDPVVKTFKNCAFN